MGKKDYYDQPGKYNPYKRDKPDGCIYGGDGDDCPMVRAMRRAGFLGTARLYLLIVQKVASILRNAAH